MLLTCSQPHFICSPAVLLSLHLFICRRLRNSFLCVIGVTIVLAIASWVILASRNYLQRNKLLKELIYYVHFFTLCAEISVLTNS